MDVQEIQAMAAFSKVIKTQQITAEDFILLLDIISNNVRVQSDEETQVKLRMEVLQRLNVWQRAIEGSAGG